MVGYVWQEKKRDLAGSTVYSKVSTVAVQNTI